MSQTLSPSFARRYGLAELRACGTSHAPASIVLASRRRLTRRRRPGPVGACSDADLAEHIRLHITGFGFHGEGYRKIWARLRAAGVRASPRRVRRVMANTDCSRRIALGEQRPKRMTDDCH